MKQFLRSFTVILTLLVLTACGSRQSEMYDNFSTDETAAADYSVTRLGITDGETYYKNTEDASETDYISNEEKSSSTVTQVSGEEDYEPKLIRNFYLSLETETYDDLLTSLRSRIENYDGYIENFSSNTSAAENGRRYADLTVRIPAAESEAFLNEGFAGSTLTYYNESTVDVSLNYTDLESRLSALKEEQKRLTELIAEAETVESIIALETRLTEVRYELENATSSLRSYDNQITYSTISISISEVSVAEVPAKAGFLDRVSTGFRKNTAAVFSTLTDLAVWLISNSVGIFIIILLAAAAYCFVKKISGKKHQMKSKPVKKTMTMKTDGSNETGGKDAEKNSQEND